MKNSKFKQFIDEDACSKEQYALDKISQKSILLISKIIEGVSRENVSICHKVAKEDIMPTLHKSKEDPNYISLMRCIKSIVGVGEPIHKNIFQSLKDERVWEWKVNNKSRVFSRKKDNFEEILLIDTAHNFSDDKNIVKNRSKGC